MTGISGRDDHQQSIVKNVCARKSNHCDHVEQDGKRPHTRLHQVQRSCCEHPQTGKRRQHAFPQSAGISHRPQYGSEDHDDQTGYRVADTQVIGAMSHLNTLTPVLFEKQREESSHDCGGKGRVGPVVQGPRIGGSALVGLHLGVFCLPAVRVSESRSVY